MTDNKNTRKNLDELLAEAEARVAELKRKQKAKDAREAAKLVCKARFEAFGAAGNASKIKPVNLDKIAAGYKSGALNQIVR